MSIEKIGGPGETLESGEILSTKEAANLLGLPTGTLRFFRSKGKGPKSFICGRLVKYRRSELIAWLRAQEEATCRGGADVA